MSASDQRHKKQNQHRQKLKTDGRGCQRRHSCHLGAFQRSLVGMLLGWMVDSNILKIHQFLLFQILSVFNSHPLLFIEAFFFGPTSGIGRFGAAIGRTCEGILPWPLHNSHPIPRPRSETHQLWLWLLLLHWSRCLLVEMTVLLNHLAPGTSNHLPRVVLQSKTSTLAKEGSPRTKIEKITFQHSCFTKFTFGNGTPKILQKLFAWAGSGRFRVALAWKLASSLSKHDPKTFKSARN